MAATSWYTSVDIGFTSLENLAFGAWAESTQIDISSVTNAHDIIIGGWIEWASAPANAEVVEVYITTPFDTANKTTTIGGQIGAGFDGVANTVTEGTHFMQENLNLLGLITTSTATSKHYMTPASVVSALGYVPFAFSLVVHNASAADNLNATDGGKFMYTKIAYGAAT